MKLPQLAIVPKLYAIFALLATVTVGLAGVAVVNARHHQALTDEFESAQAGAANVERVNALIYAVVMESRGVYMSSGMAEATAYADGVLVFNGRIGKVVETWRKSVRSEDAVLFDAFARRIDAFQGFRLRAGATREAGRSASGAPMGRQRRQSQCAQGAQQRSRGAWRNLCKTFGSAL